MPTFWQLPLIWAEVTRWLAGDVVLQRNSVEFRFN